MADETQDRTIEELVREKTFQDMSDSEIVKIILFAIQLTRQQDLNNTLIEQNKANNEIIKQYYMKMADNADKQLEDLIKSGTQYLQTVDVSENE